MRHYALEQAGLSGGVGAVREVPSGYLFFADQIVEIGDEYQTHAVVWRLDNEGNVLAITDQWAGSMRQSNFNFPDPIDELHNGLFVVPLIDDSMGYDRRISIHLVDDLGTTVQSYVPIQCQPEDSTVVTMRDVAISANGGIWLTGAVDSLPQELDTNPMLAKMDQEGSLLWKKEYQVPNQLHEGCDVEGYVDGGAVVFGHRGAPGYENKNFILRVDSNGNLLWRRYMGYRASGSYGSVAVDADGNILTWNRYSDVWNASDWKLQLIKWDPDGNIIWDSRTHLDYQSSPFDMYLEPNGSTVACARVNDQGTICKFSAEGDSLWTRTYSLFTYSAVHTLFDVEPTADGGIVAAGYVGQGGNDPEPGLQTLWMIRMDSMGCVVPGCHTVGVAEYEMSLQEKLAVQPNPAHEQVEFSLPLPAGYRLVGAVQAVVLDAQGKEVLRQPISTNTVELRSTVGVRALPPGLYYLHLRDDAKWLAGSKVVVE